MRMNQFVRRGMLLLTASLFCLVGCSAVPGQEKSVEASASVIEMEAVSAEASIPAAESSVPEEPASSEEESAQEPSAEAESAQESAASEGNDSAEKEHARKPGAPLREKKGSVLVFASDFQHKDGWADQTVTLSGVLDSVYEAKLQPDNLIFCGDYTTRHGHKDYYSDTHLAVEKIKEIVLDHDPDFPVEDMIFNQGNHDELTDDISESGLHEYPDYLVYVLNMDTDFPWRQGVNGSKKLVQQAALRLKKCLEGLIEQGETRPVFLAGHVPLHFSGRTSKLQGTGDNLYAEELFEVINEAAADLNLVYLYGHNHSRGWDSYLGGSCVFRAPGDWLLIPRPEEGERVTSNYSKETIRFTYLNAGYVGYFSSAGGEETLTCTVCELFDDSMRFSRYAVDGIHILSAEGAANPAKDDRALIPSEYYGERLDSPYSVDLKKYSAAVLKKAA